MLTFELAAEKNQIEIHADEKGITELRLQLDALCAGATHVHLMTLAWGGNELSEEAQGENNEVVNHVKIFYWPDQ